MGHKTISMDYDTYKEDLNKKYSEGYNAALEAILSHMETQLESSPKIKEIILVSFKMFMLDNELDSYRIERVFTKNNISFPSNEGASQ